MCAKKLSHFRLADDVITKLTVCAVLAQKDKTKILEHLVRINYDDAARCLPEKVKAIHAELEQKANGSIR
jgi:hypothetical protein